MKNEIILGKNKPFNYDLIKPNEFLTNKIFSEIASVNSVGNYQYSNEHFIYREQNDILNLNKIHIEVFVAKISEILFKKLNVSTNIESTQFGKYYVVLKQGTNEIYKTRDFNTHLEALIKTYIMKVKK